MKTDNPEIIDPEGDGEIFKIFDYKDLKPCLELEQNFMDKASPNHSANTFYEHKYKKFYKIIKDS